MILLVGASASGKTEVAKKLRSDFGIVKAITHTTRLPRSGETNHVDYHFVTEDEFLKLKEKDAFVETTFYNGRYYGCSKKEIANDKCVVVDPNGFRSFKALNNPSIITFFLDAKSDIRERRMHLRGDDPEAIASRLANDKLFFPNGKALDVDFIIDSNTATIEEITQQIYNIYIEELKKRG